MSQKLPERWHILIRNCHCCAGGFCSLHKVPRTVLSDCVKLWDIKRVLLWNSTFRVVEFKRTALQKSKTVWDGMLTIIDQSITLHTIHSFCLLPSWLAHHITCSQVKATVASSLMSLGSVSRNYGTHNLPIYPTDHYNALIQYSPVCNHLTKRHDQSFEEYSDEAINIKSRHKAGVVRTKVQDEVSFMEPGVTLGKIQIWYANVWGRTLGRTSESCQPTLVWLGGKHTCSKLEDLRSLAVNHARTRTDLRSCVILSRC